MIKNDIKIMIKKIRVYGIRGCYKKIRSRAMGQPESINVMKFYDFILDDKEIPLQKEQMTPIEDGVMVNWIVPQMDLGSGGHMNIFRFITMLENQGIHNRIYLHRAPNFPTDRELRSFLKEHYNIGNDKVEVYHDVSQMTFAHATIATSWPTAYYLRKFNNTISKFYFVQDFESYFAPMGTEYLLAENTYKFGFRGITAGDWLKNKLHNEYGMDTASCGFSYDKDLYHPGEKRDNVKRIFFYARPVTPRRAFDLGMLALYELSRRMPDIEVIFAGWDISNYEVPFKHLNEGSLRLEELSDVYAQCDMCLVMSTTNLSLLPLEVMASNSVVVCTEGENNSWLVNESNAIIVDYDPLHIADTMEAYLKDRDKLSEIRKKGLEFANNTSWEKEGKKVFDYIMKGIQEDGQK